MLNHRELRDTKATEYMSHEEKYRYNLARAAAILKLIDDEGMGVDEIRYGAASLSAKTQFK